MSNQLPIFVKTYEGATGQLLTSKLSDSVSSEGIQWLAKHLYWAMQNGKVVVVGPVDYQEPPA